MIFINILIGSSDPGRWRFFQHWWLHMWTPDNFLHSGRLGPDCEQNRQTPSSDPPLDQTPDSTANRAERTMNKNTTGTRMTVWCHRYLREAESLDSLWEGLFALSVWLTTSGRFQNHCVVSLNVHTILKSTNILQHLQSDNSGNKWKHE